MTRRLARARGLLSAGVGTGTLALLARPVAAQSANRELIDGLHVQLLYVALPLTLFVLVILAYAVIRFRDNDDPRPTVEDPPLEITWTVATGLILLFVGVSSYTVLATPYLSPGVVSEEGIAGTGENPLEPRPDDEVVEVTAYQWEWEATYPEANVTTQNLVVLPVDRDVSILATSRDVVHSFSVPDLRLKQDVYPRQESLVRTTATEEGTYTLHCAEFCGPRHAYMLGEVVVVDEETYESWLDDHEGETNVTEPPAVGPE